VVQGGLASPLLFSLYGNDAAAQCHHVDVAHQADDTIMLVTWLLCYRKHVLRNLKEQEVRLECHCSVNYLLICVVRNMKTRLREV